MAAGTSSEKSARVAERKRARNKPIRSSLKTHVKTAQTVVASGETEDAKKAVNGAISALDKAARKHVIHPNSAARRKSRLMSALAKIKAPAAEAKPTKATKATKAKSAAKPKATTGKAKAPAKPKS